MTTDSNVPDPNAVSAGCCDSCDSADSTTAQPSKEHTDMEFTTYTVAGMTCDHCVSAVSTEIGKLTGVSDVQVDLPTGAVTVASAAPLPPGQVLAAVEEAGYELAATGGTTTDGGRAG
ncbi:MAG: heavy-metal-associated domain-containing protein [Nocardioides sp.]